MHNGGRCTNDNSAVLYWYLFWIKYTFYHISFPFLLLLLGFVFVFLCVFFVFGCMCVFSSFLPHFVILITVCVILMLLYCNILFVCLRLIKKIKEKCRLWTIHQSALCGFVFRSPTTRFRWLQQTSHPRGTVWALDNVYLGDGCPWLCSGHGYCQNHTCV